MRRIILGSAALLASVAQLAFAQGPAGPDCALGQRYLELAQQQVEAYQDDEAVQYLKRAVETCPSYDAYQQLGEVSAQSPDPADKAQAVQAFVSAHELAPTDQARARSLYQYARLLNREGDPQNAYPLIKDAQRLDPGNADIATLAASVDAQIQNPSQEHLVRGLRDSLYQPLKVAFRTAPGPEEHPGRSSGGGAPPYVGPAINIPIHFDTGTTRVAAETRPNVTKLASALADPSMAGRTFVFIGHADERGGETENLNLSKQRAEVIYQAVTLVEPSLEGRVEVMGRGEYEPIDHGTNEDAYRANRRLQVVLR